MSELPKPEGPARHVPRKKVEVRLSAEQAARLRQLWGEHSGALHAMLVGWCGDAHNASDVLQEVFRRLAVSPALMAQMKNARAFLAVSARRIAVDFARRSTTRAAYHAAAGAETPASENRGLSDAALRAAIAKAVESLPNEQRAVFEHKVLRGRTLEEISKLENISLNTAASRLRYALDKIRGQLRPYYDDLNRKNFKLMKNDPSNTEDTVSQRIITPLAPKRVPSVAPGLEGLAAMAPDDACEAAPEIVAPEPEFVEVVPASEGHFDQSSPDVSAEISSCGIGENAWEHSGAPEPFEMPAFVTCEVLPPDGEIPREWLEQPENLFVTLFEGGHDSAVDGNAIDGTGIERVPFDFESGFEVCVLPTPQEHISAIDPNELLLRYDAFLADNPGWNAPNPDLVESQVVTPSSYFGDLEFGTPGAAGAFDKWYETNYAHVDGDGVGTVDGSGLVLDGSADFPSEIFLNGGEIVDGSRPDGSGLTEGTSLVLGGSGHFEGGTILSGGDDASDDASHPGDFVFQTSGTITDVRGGVLNLSGEWLRADGAGVLGGSGLVLSGDGDHSDLNTGAVDGSGLVLHGKSDFEGETIVTGGIIVDGDNAGDNHAGDDGGLTGGNLQLNGGGDFVHGTVLSGGGVLTTADSHPFQADAGLQTGTLVLGGKGALSEIQPHWRNGGVPEFAYSTAAGGSGLVLSGSGGEIVSQGTPVEGAGTIINAPGLTSGGTRGSDPDVAGLASTTGSFQQSTVVTGGELVLKGDAAVEKVEGNALTLSDGSSVILEGGRVVSGQNVYTFSPDMASGNAVSAELQAEPDALPAEVVIADAATTAAPYSLGNPAAGLAPDAGHALVVEFGVLSPSESFQEPSTQVAPTSVDYVLPHSVASDTTQAEVDGIPAAASNASAPNDALPLVAATSHEAAADAPLAHKVDAPTAAAGAVAAGTVVQSGAISPSVRRPLPRV